MALCLKVWCWGCGGKVTEHTILDKTWKFIKARCDECGKESDFYRHKMEEKGKVISRDRP